MTCMLYNEKNIHANRSKVFRSHTTGSNAKPTAAAWPKLFQVR